MELDAIQNLNQELVSLDKKHQEHAAEINKTLTGFTAQQVLAFSIAVDRELGGFFSKRNTSRSGVSNFCSIHSSLITQCEDLPEMPYWLDGSGMPPLDFVAKTYPAVQATPEDHALAADILDYFSGLIYKVFTRKLTEFEQRVISFIDQKHITVIDNRNIAISASLPEIYRNNLQADGWAREEKSLAATAKAEGRVGEYREFRGEIRHVRNMSKSNSVLIAVVTEQGNIVKFFWSGFRKNTEVNITKLFVPGNTIHFMGVVKKQGPTDHGDAVHNMVTHVDVLSVT